MRLFTFIVSFTVFSCLSQHGVKLLYEDLPLDSMSQKEFTSHTAFQPNMRWSGNQFGKKVLNIGKKDGQKWLGLNPVVDAVYRTTNELQMRHGAGIQVETNFRKPWYFRANVLAGTGNSDSLFALKSWGVKANNNGSFNYLDLTGRLAYTPNQVFNFQIGLDNNFIGEGCRSLFLSDYGSPSPFAQLNARFWRVEYTTLYQFMREGSAGNYTPKFGATHHLSFNATKWLNFGVFESVIFQPRDTSLQRGFDVEYLNPVIFYRPQEYSLGSSDNVLLGASMTIKWKAHSFYTQLIIDEFSLTEMKARSGWWANKFGGQIGVKGRTTHNKWKGFYRVEYNFVRPYTYAHLTSGQNYGNQGYSLAHPYGSNVMEILGEFKIQKDKWLAKAFVSYFLQGWDKEGYSYGSNVYQPYTLRPFEYGHKIGQGLGNNGMRVILSLSYTLSKYGNLQVFTEQHVRYDSAVDQLMYAPVIGLRNTFRNDYRNY